MPGQIFSGCRAATVKAKSTTTAPRALVISVNNFVRYKIQNARIIFMILHFAISPFFTPYVLYSL
jgi:hypothetical protein